MTTALDSGFSPRDVRQFRRRMLEEAAAIRRGEFVLIPPRQPAPDEVERRKAAAVDALLAVLDGEEDGLP